MVGRYSYFHPAGPARRSLRAGLRWAIWRHRILRARRKRVRISLAAWAIFFWLHGFLIAWCSLAVWFARMAR